MLGRRILNRTSHQRILPWESIDITIHLIKKLAVRNQEENTMKVIALLAALSAASVEAFSAIKAGSKIPAVDLFHDFDPDAKHNIAEYTANKKCAVVGLPGAFTPTW